MCHSDWKQGMYCQVRRPSSCPDIACDTDFACDHPKARLYSKEACRKARSNNIK